MVVKGEPLSIPPPEGSPAARRARRCGVAFAAAAVLACAPDGCLLRSMQAHGAGNDAIFAFKFLLAAVVQLAFVLYKSGLRVFIRTACSCWPWVVMAALFTVGAALNTLSNLETTSVSALLFFYIAPLWALVMGVAILQEVLRTRTVCAVLLAFVGVGCIFVPSILHRNDPHKATHGAAAARHVASLHGDVLGLISGVCMAGYLTTCRHAKIFAPDAEATMVIGVATGSLISGCLGLSLVWGHGDLLWQSIPRSAWPFLLLDTFGIAVYGILSALATQHLPGAEVAFLLLIDIVIAPLLVCLVHGEVPTRMAQMGAGLLAFAVVGHEFAAMRESRIAAHKVAVAGREGGATGDGWTPPPVKLRMSDANLASLGEGVDGGGPEEERGLLEREERSSLGTSTPLKPADDHRRAGGSLI